MYLTNQVVPPPVSLPELPPLLGLEFNINLTKSSIVVSGIDLHSHPLEDEPPPDGLESNINFTKSSIVLSGIGLQSHF